MKKALLLNITLKNVKPKIWRKIWIENDISFFELHWIIQIAMGWENYHLFEFMAANNHIGPINEYSDGSIMNAEEILVSDYLTNKGNKLTYVYDFGDDWEHIIKVDQIETIDTQKKYPLCVGGKQNCPPEDCGGPWGYEELVDIIGDKKHPEHKDMLEWVGKDFDPTYFDLKETNEDLASLNELSGGESKMDMNAGDTMSLFIEKIMEHLPEELRDGKKELKEEDAQAMILKMLSGSGGKEIQGIMQNLIENNPDALYQEDGSVNESFVDEGMAKAMGISMDEKPPLYEGYSAFEMQKILYQLFDDACPVQFNKMEQSDYLQIPMLNQIKYLIEIIEREKSQSLKLTTKGFLPVKVVKELYGQGFILDKMIENGISKVYREAEILPINLARLLLELSGITKKRNNKISLTKKGQKIIKDDHTFLMTLLETFVNKYNWGYYDGYDIGSLDQEGFGFTLLLLSRYGGEKQLDKFYAQKFIAASGNAAALKDEALANSYCVRTFSRFLKLFGLVKIESEEENIYWGEQYITTTETFDKLIRLVPPKMTVVR